MSHCQRAARRLLSSLCIWSIIVATQCADPLFVTKFQFHHSIACWKLHERVTRPATCTRVASTARWNIQENDTICPLYHTQPPVLHIELYMKSDTTCCLHHMEPLAPLTEIRGHALGRVIVYEKVNVLITLVITSTSTLPIMCSESNRGRLYKMSTSFQPIRSRDFSRRYGNT